MLCLAIEEEKEKEGQQKPFWVPTTEKKSLSLSIPFLNPSHFCKKWYSLMESEIASSGKIAIKCLASEANRVQT